MIDRAAEAVLIEKEMRRRKRQKSFLEFSKAVFDDLKLFSHTRKLIRAMQMVGDDKAKRVMIMMPPRYGKSQFASMMLPAWYLFKHPKRQVGLASYGFELARRLSGHAIENYQKVGGKLHPRFQSSGGWQTEDGGVMWASGAGGPITGFGANLLILDDSVKNREEADSAVEREKNWDWYRSTFYTRLHPGASLVVIGTRWHERDILGMILSEAEAKGEQWRILLFDQLYDPTTRDNLPKNAIVEPDWRKPGAYLCPGLFPKEEVDLTRATLGHREFAALHQQTPIPRDGSIFKQKWIKMQQARPEEAERVRSWDLAGTEGGGDYTAGVLMSKTPENTFVVEDVVRGQWSPGRRDAMVQATAKRDGRLVDILIEAESGIGGAQRTQALVGKLAGYNVSTERPTGSKIHRAEPLAAQMEAGNVSILEGLWAFDFIEELMAFGGGSAHDDQVDAASGGFNRLALQEPKTARVTNVRLW